MSESGYRPTADDLLGHAEFIRALAVRLVRDDALAEDAVQETFARALESPPRGASKLRAWLARVVRNASLMRLRGEKRRRGREQVASRPERLSSPAEAAERIETQHRVIEAVRGLDEPYRSVVVHRFFEGLTVAEIAALGESPEDTVRTRIRRALAKLRERLDESHGGDRRRWMAALLPLAGLAGSASAGAAAGVAVAGGLLMGGKKVALTAAVVVLVAVGFGVSGLFGEWGEGKPSAPGGEVPDASPTTVATSDPASTPDPTKGVIAGTVTRGAVPVEARVEARLLAEIDPLATVPRYRTPYDWDTRALDHATETGTPVASTAATGGAFRIEGVGPGLYLVVARDADGGTATGFARVLCSGHEAAVHLELSAGSESISARAVWSDDRPFRGQVSAVRPGAGPHDAPVTTSTGPDGRFTLRHLTKGRVDLLFVQRGGICASIPGVRVPLGRAAEFVVDYDLAPVTGRVLGPKDVPVSGAEIRVWSQRRGNSRVLSRCLSEEDGSFRVLAAGSSLLASVSAPGFLPRDFRFDAGARYTMRLEPSPALSGRVVRAADGSPVAGIPVYARGLGDRARQVHTVTDAEGRFRLGSLPALEVMAFAHGGGLVSERLAEVRAGGGNPLALSLGAGGRREIELRVVPAAQATGSVRETTGEGVAGVLVHARIDLPYPTNWRSITSLGLARVATDGEGRFDFDTLLPGVPYRFEALPDHRTPAEAGPLTALSGSPLEVDFTLDPVRRLRVVVTDAETGDGLPGVTVRCMSIDDRGGGTGFGWDRVTGPGGVAVVAPVPADRIGVQVGHPRYASEYRYHIVPGSDGAATDLRFETSLGRGLTISGRILRKDGTPAAGVVTPIPVGVSYPWPNPFYVPPAIGEDGSFVLRFLVPGNYRIQVRESDGRVHEIPTVVKAGSADVTLTVAASGAPLPPLLRLLDAGGKPVPSAKAWFRSPGRLSTVTTGIGTVVNGFARPHQALNRTGSRWIEVHPTEAADGTSLGGTLAGPFDADLEEVEVRLAPAVTIEGRVVGPEGEPVRGVRLNAFVARWAEDVWAKPHATTLSDEVGRFRLRGLSAIEWRIETKPPQGYTAREAVTVRGGETGVAVILVRGVSPTVTVLDEKGRPVPEQTVEVRALGAPTGNGFDRRTAPDGRARFEGLDPTKRYVLHIRLFSNCFDLFPMVIEEWVPKDTVVRLRIARTLSGRVVDPRGDPALGAKVQVWPDDADPGMFEEYSVNDEGRFEFGRLPEGRVRVRVRPAGGFTERTEWKRIEAGSRDLLLRTELRHRLEVELPGGTAAFQRQNAWLLPEEGKYQVPEEDYRPMGLVLRYCGLIPGRTYAIRCPSPDRKRLVWRRGIAADAGKVKIEYRPTARGSGRVIAAEGVKGLGVTVVWAGHHRFPVKLREDGTFSFENVPDDVVVLRATGRFEGRELKAEKSGRPGDGIELRLGPPKSE
jgi:RNA polymerase sigma-70 factor (ECF subfamily)